MRIWSLFIVMTLLCTCSLGDGSGNSRNSGDASVKEGTEVGNGNKPGKADTTQDENNSSGHNRQPTSHPTTCDGTIYAGFCVMMGKVGASCSETCGGKAKVNGLTYLMLGTPTSEDQCTAVLNQIHSVQYPVDVVEATTAFPATGCSLIEKNAYIFYGAAETDPDAKRENLARVCICNIKLP
jgi:hypothetical protein